MPRRKIQTATRGVRKTPSTRKPLSQAGAWQRVKNFKWGESYTSLLLGVVVVIVSVLFGVSIIRGQSHVQQTSSLSTTSTQAVTTPTPTATQLGATLQKNGKTVYVVKAGDDLWSISDHFYHDGYRWTDIAKANNLADPSSIFSGNELVIPQTKVATSGGKSAIHEVVSASPNAIIGSSYTVVAGDDLWSIAVRAYADGYKWTDIAKANNLSDPGLIFSGNVLKIPR